jgi:23S rRNA (uracil1939-C5)-methyltransferase
MPTPSALPPQLESVPDGKAVVCPHAELCGGCPLIGLPYPQQLELKRHRLLQAKARYPALEAVAVEPVLPAYPIAGYRTRAKLIVAQGGALGLYAKGGGHNVVDIPQCQVLAPGLSRVAAVLRESISAAERTGGAIAPLVPHPRGPLRAVDLREVVKDTDGRVLVTFVVERSRVPTLAALQEAARELMRTLPEVAGVAANLHDGVEPQILGSETVTLAGEAAIEDRVGASVHIATFGSFVQAHRVQAGVVHHLIAGALGLAKGEAPPPSQNASRTEPLKILDLYGGSGSIGLALAGMGAQVRLVETFPPAVAQARAAARAQGLDVQAECGDVVDALRTLSAAGARLDAAVLNPPRRGTSPGAREWLARLEPKVIVYVSCDPETLGRDLDHLARLGYRTESLRPLDMIPLTDEIETVAVLRHVGIAPARVAYEDDQVLIVEKGPHEPTTPQGEYASSLLARVRRVPGAEEAVPVHRLDVGTGGLVIFARKPEFVALWSQVLASPTTRKIYVAAVRGVAPSKGAVTRELRENGKTFPARTRYRRLGVAARHSVLRVIPEQGRTHQIRRHLAAIGHPVLGDDRYGDAATNRHFAEKNGLDRAFLHCVRLELDDPRSGVRLVVETPLAGDLRAVLERTSGAGTLRFLDHKNALGRSRTSTLPPPSPSAEHHQGGPLDLDTRPSLLPQKLGDDDEVPED